MNKKWSLKGKRYLFDVYDGYMECEDSFEWMKERIDDYDSDRDMRSAWCIEAFPDNPPRIGKEYIYYKKADIEILRWKLIEDMIKYMDSIGYARYYDEVEMIKIINGRFGVNEDE